MSNPELNSFEEWFFRDLEKGFDSDIACCDNCHDEFIEFWPYADSTDDFEFQTRGIDLNWFYEHSRLRDEYSKSDFDRLISQMSCPRCGSALGGTIWAYNFPFDVPRDIEHIIREVSALADESPFLLLEHEFCRQVLSAIRALAGTINPEPLTQHLFRGRSEVRGPIEESIHAFDFPPPMYVQEGRYNHSGHSVLYLGSDVETCHAELRNTESLIVELAISGNFRILDLISPYKADQSNLIDTDLLNCLVYSSLVSSKQEVNGWHRPHYTVSRFVADCARSSGIDAIKYPSTRKSGGNYNLVLLNTSHRLEHVARAVQFHRRSTA